MLINRPVPLEGESLGSYLFRVGLENYCTVDDFERRLNVPDRSLWHSECSSEVLDEICTLVNYSKARLYSMTLNSYVNQLGSTPSKKLITKSTVKYCPECIKEQLIHKLIWMLRPLSICLDHQTILVDRCVGCGVLLELKGLMRGCCSQCGYALLQAKGYSVRRESWMFQSQIDIQKRLQEHKGTGITADYNFVEYVDLAIHSFHLLQGLNSFVEPKDHMIQAFYKQRDTNLNNFELALAYANSYWMFENTEHFYQALHDFNKKHHDIKYEQKKQFEHVFRLGKFPNVREHYERYWLKEVDSGNIRKDFSVFKKSTSLLGRRVYISKEEAQSKLRVTARRLERFKRYSPLEVKVLQRGKQSLHLVKESDLKTIIEADKGFVTRRKAAQMLGVHANTVRVLVKHGFLTEKLSLSGHLLIPIDDIMRLLRSCIGTFRKGSRGLRLHDAIIKYRLNGLTMNELLRLIQSGIVATTTNRCVATLADILVNDKQLYRCIQKRIEERQQQQGYTLDEVRKILAVRDRTIQAMTEHGILVPNRIIKGDDGRNHCWFDKQIIDQFRREHIRLQQAAEKYRIPGHRLHRWLKQGKLNNCTEGITRRPMLRHDEIKRMLRESLKRGVV